ncbi:MAG: glycosyltransferase, partial [Crenarchaeota archaeon]|nr:glycosyltransferase [Thermoproteota archaeon]
MGQKLVSNSNLTRIVYLSTYPPRECGIANFTKDLIDAIGELDGFSSSIIAVNEKSAIYDYDKRVKLKIDRDNIQDYIAAAEYVNASKSIKLVFIQHEFGLFGGNYGEYLNFFLEKVNKPVVTILHTVQPDFDQKAIEILRYIAKRSEAIVVIANAAVNMLKKQDIPFKKCVVIPHGCPDVAYVDNKSVKAVLDLKNRLVASTFGLLSSGKGIEYVIKALPEVVKKDPRIIYLIIGETHPEVRKHEGEKYRNNLMRLVTKLGLDEHVRFTNRFITKRELIRYLQATDIYLTPYISPNQISSGTLIYALGAGKAVVSTPYFHAQEVLANGRGILCKFQDSASIAAGMQMLLNEDFRNQIQKRAYIYSRRFLWKNVAEKYLNLINTVTKQNECTQVENLSYKYGLCQSSNR